MRYAIFSDVHANRQAWDAVLADALQQGADTLICLGDVVGYGPKPQEVLQAVRDMTPNFVLGNHDAAACGRLDASIFNERARTVIEWTRGQLDEDSHAFLQQVPLQMDGQGLQFLHAEVIEPGEFGYVDSLSAAEPNLKAMVHPLAFIGHTHLPLAYSMPKRGGQVKQLPPHDFKVESGRRYLVNVGSVGEPRTTDVRASYVIYDEEEKTVSFRKVVFDVEAYRADLLATGLDIFPYFLQVVDAGKEAGTPPPAAAPQLALAQLPAVTQVVAGNHASLVVAAPVARIPGSPLRPVVGAKSGSTGLIVALVSVLVLLGAVLAFVLSGGEEEETAGQETEKEVGTGNEQVSSRKNPRRSVEVSDHLGTGPIKSLEVQFFGTAVKSLGELRAADDSGDPTLTNRVRNGVLSLDFGDEDKSFGLVWEGALDVPESGEYEFSLDATSGAALYLYGSVKIEMSAAELGKPSTTKVRMRKGLAPFRLEYIHAEGPMGLALHWSGPGLEDEQYLSKSRGRLVEARPAPEREAPEKMSEGLLAYWSFDTPRAPKTRISQAANGNVLETFVAAEDQTVQIHIPRKDEGNKWKQPGFDAGGWKTGGNGVGYEVRPGPFKDLIKTKVEGQSGKYPHSVYLRFPFTVKDPRVYKELALSIRYDDGFVAYLNGKQISSNNASTPLLWNSGAPRTRGREDASKKDLLKVSRALRHLVEGENILAIHLLNAGGTPTSNNDGCSSDDIFALPELVALRTDMELPREAAPRTTSSHDRKIGKAEIEGIVTSSEGKFLEAFQFKGGSLEIGESDAFAIGEDSFTLSAWFKREPGSSDSQARRLLSAGAGNDEKGGWALWVMGKGAGLTFAISDGETRSELAAREEGMIDGAWRHVAVTVYRDTNEVALFLNGELMDDRKMSLLEDADIDSNSGLSIGRNSDDEQHHLGALDDVVLWRRALLPEEVKKIYESGKSIGDLFNVE